MKETIAFLAGIITATLAGVAFGVTPATPPYPIPKTASKEIHVHADFIVFLNGEQIDFTTDKYQSSGEQILSDSIHLHDNEGHLIHRHAAGITLSQFFSSLGFTLTDTCIATDTGAEYCTNTVESLLLFVNDESEPTIAEYVIGDEDQLLLYFGAPGAPVVDELLGSITDEACIYSGTCPKRGTPPPESCGLTCEL